MFVLRERVVSGSTRFVMMITMAVLTLPDIYSCFVPGNPRTCVQTTCVCKVIFHSTSLTKFYRLCFPSRKQTFAKQRTRPNSAPHLGIKFSALVFSFWFSSIVRAQRGAILRVSLVYLFIYFNFLLFCVTFWDFDPMLNILWNSKYPKKSILFLT